MFFSLYILHVFVFLVYLFAYMFICLFFSSVVFSFSMLVADDLEE